jgi:hypothetical protein
MAGLAPQHPKLMPKDQDLQILASVASVREDEQAGEEADGQPEHEEHRGIVRNACSRHEAEFPRPTRRLSTSTPNGCKPPALAIVRGK